MEDMKNEADTTTSAVSMALYTVMYPVFKQVTAEECRELCFSELFHIFVFGLGSPYELPQGPL